MNTEGLSSRWSGGRGSSQEAPECEQVCEGSEGVSRGDSWANRGNTELRGTEMMGVMLLTLNQEDTHKHTHIHIPRYTYTHAHTHVNTLHTHTHTPQG